MMRFSISSTRARRAGMQLAVAAALIGSGAVTWAQATDSPVGVWRTIDDKTGKPKALIKIVEQNGEYTGTIIKGLEPNDDPNRVCTACTGARKGQKMLGMEIMEGIHKDGDVYDGGHILDPENGMNYSCKLKVVDGGQKLKVRGYLGISLLGRTQTWIREQ